MSISTSEYYSNFPPNPSSYRKDSARRFASPPATSYRREEADHDSTNTQVHHIRKWYESRVKGLSDDIRNAFTLIQSDALIDTMKHDTASEEYISQRVKEIIEDCLSNDRELLLEKMALQNAYLKGEFSNSEQENIKIINELNNRLERLQEEYRNEAQAREYFEREVQNLKYGTDELAKSYENTLRMTEDEVNKKAEQDHVRIRELEGRLKDGEDRHFEMIQKQSGLQKELENMRNQMKELEIEKNKVQEKFKSTTGIIDDYEKLEGELKRTINSLKEEVLDVKANLSTVVLQKKEMENKYKRMIDEISNDNEEKDEKIQRSHKEKVEQYKRKVIEYKERLGEKEKELRDLRERHEDNDHKKQRNIDLLENKIQEQRNYYEEMARSLEEENYRRTTELKERNEEELREVEIEFKRLLDEKLSQLQEESDEQITELKKQEREVQLLLEERNKEMERDYIPLKHHEKVIEEKNALLQTLKDELKRMELENRQEMSMRLKSLEERLFTEHNAQVKALKVVIDDRELQIKELTDQNKIIDQELKLINEERRALGDSVQQLELQKRKLHESAEEWAEKSRRVKAAFEEEQGRNNELERELRSYQERYNQTVNQLEETVIEVEERRSEVANLSNEVNTLGMSLKGSSKERKKLDQELSEFNRSLLEAQERIRRLEEENSEYKQDNEALEEKVKEILESGEERFTREANEHVKTKVRLQSAEDQVVLMENELDDNRDKIDEMKGQIEDIERRNEELERSQEANKEKIERLLKEKRTSERNIDQILIRITAWRRANEDKLDFMRKEMDELKSTSTAQISSLIRENEMAILKLMERVNSVFDQKARKFQQEKEEFAAQMEMEFNQNYGSLRAEYEDKYLDLQESFELKSLEHERQLEYKDDAYGRLLERANELSKELERRDLRQAQTENELNRTRKAKEEASMNLDHTTQKLTRELDLTKDDLRKATEESERARKEMEEKYSAEIGLLNKEIEKFSEGIKSYEDKLRSLMTEYEGEKMRSTREFQETRGQLEASLKASKGAEDMLITKVSKLEQRINELKRVEIDVRRENEDTKMAYEKRVEEFENKMNEIMKTMEEGEEAMATFRQGKIQEMNQYLGTIHILQEEVTMKNDKVSKLLEERDRFEIHLKEIESEVMKKANQFDEEKQELMGLTTAQAQEIEQLHVLLSSSYRPSASKEETGGISSSTRKREVNNRPETAKNMPPRLKSNLSRTEKAPEYYSNSTPTMRMEKEKARTIHPYNQENKYHSANRDSDRSKRR